VRLWPWKQRAEEPPAPPPPPKRPKTGDDLRKAFLEKLDSRQEENET
jgi:hypothetical protein